MKNKLFKIGKPMLSVIVAVAILALSLFVAVPGISFSADAATVTDTWDGTMATGFKSGTGTEDDPYIIATAEQLAYAALGAQSVSQGKYFKVVDDAVFDLNGMKDITLDSEVGDVLVAEHNLSWKPANENDKTFSGYFDGNGVIIYNMYSANGSGTWGQAGLFPRAANDQTGQTRWVKNITLINSRSHGYHYAGGIVGIYEAPDGGNTLTIENCNVYNCVMSDKNNTNPVTHKTTGIIAGSVTHNNTTIKNCIVKNNVTSATEISGGLVGQTSAWSGGFLVQNCIVIGSLPYPTVHGTRPLEKYVGSATSYSGVYTTEDVDASFSVKQVKKVAEADMKGPTAKSAMPDFDWETWIAFDGEMPDFRANHTLTLQQKDESTHNIACTDCGKAMAETHNITEDATGTIGSCECGYSGPITIRREDDWDGNYDNQFAAGSGTKDDPYIIKTAEQMAYVALKSTPADSADKYYKVAPYMVFNMNGLIGITMDSTAEQVRDAAEGRDWINDNNKFAGNFDGNGVIIYNLRSSNGRANGYSALFPRVSTDNSAATTTIKNITVMASRFKGYHYSAGIVAVADCSVTKQKVFVENCAVKNCYIGDGGNTNTATSRTAATIVGSFGNNTGAIDNCLSVGNILAGTDISGGFLGNTGAYCDPATIKNSVMIGSMPYPVQISGLKGIDTKAISSDCFANVYTDQAISGYGKNQIRSLTADMMSGVSAPQNMDLDFGAYWFANKGLVDLLVCHNIEGAVNSENPYAGHGASCKECDLESVMILNHQYNGEYTCTVCGFTCDHKNEEFLAKTEFTNLDCITPKNTRIECACGYAEQIDHSKALGHVLEKTEAKAPTCAQDGNVEYWTCENCECIFLTDDVMASYDSAVTAAQVTLKATGEHTIEKDSEGKNIYGMDDESHWIICTVCYAKLSRVEHTVIYPDKDATTHNSQCEICLYQVAEKQAHTFAQDSKTCDLCEFDCDHNGTIVAVDVSEPTCTSEGVSTAHYKCTICDVRFSDAEATTEIEKETVILEKLGHKHLDVDDRGTPVHQFNETHHWYNCEVCGKGDYAEHTMVEDAENYEGTYKWCEDETGYGCNYSTFDYSVSSEENDITVTATTNAFTKDVITDIYRVKKDDMDYEKIEALFTEKGYSSFEPYLISPSQELNAGGKASITATVSEIYGLRAEIVFVDLEKGTLEIIDSEITTIPDPTAKKNEDKVIPLINATTERFGYFAVVSGLEAENTLDGTLGGDNNSTSPPTGENVFAIATLIAILASVTILFVRKAKI